MSHISNTSTRIVGVVSEYWPMIKPWCRCSGVWFIHMMLAADLTDIIMEIFFLSRVHFYENLKVMLNKYLLHIEMRLLCYLLLFWRFVYFFRLAGQLLCHFLAFLKSSSSERFKSKLRRLVYPKHFRCSELDERSSSRAAVVALAGL